MKILKEPIREDRYLNVKVDTFPVEFNLFDSAFHDFSNHTYCVVLNDGEKEVILEFAESKIEALEKHKEHYDRLLLRPTQWFDVKSKKFRYVSYKDLKEKISDIITIEEKDLYKAFIQEIQGIVVNCSNNALTFYTKRESTEYSRKAVFSIFSGLRVKVGQLRNTSYAGLKPTDIKIIQNFVKHTDLENAEKFLKNMYKQGEEHEKWEMFVDLLEAKISEYYKEGDRSTTEAPSYIVLEELLKEVEDRIALTQKPATADTGTGGGDKADWTKRYSLNVTGKFYVDEKCINCDACAAAAPKFFKLNDQHAFVYKQPTTPEEIDLCNKALAGCPATAIGSDGDVMANAGAKKVEEKPKVEAKVPVQVPPKVEVKNEETIDTQKEIEALKNMISSVPSEKLEEVKALLKTLVPEVKTQEVKKEVENIVIIEATPAPAIQGGAKPLPEKSPDGSNIYSENVAGLFYVDDKCIACDACVNEAPNFFVIQDGHAYVFAQPQNDAEIAQCQASLSGCPVSAINKNE